jgi:hypothetical protein
MSPGPQSICLHVATENCFFHFGHSLLIYYQQKKSILLNNLISLKAVVVCQVGID